MEVHQHMPQAQKSCPLDKSLIIRGCQISKEEEEEEGFLLLDEHIRGVQ